MGDSIRRGGLEGARWADGGAAPARILGDASSAGAPPYLRKRLAGKHKRGWRGERVLAGGGTTDLRVGRLQKPRPTSA